MPKQNRGKLLVLIVAGSIFTCVVLVVALAFVNDMPGGLADRRMSHDTRQTGTLHIPFGKTPEEAIQKLRHFPSMHVIHREPVKGGVMLFIKRFSQQNGTDLQVEYVRKTWFGWKWGWGGGFGLNSSMASKAGLDYMGMPKMEGIQTPFPMEFGDVLDPSVKQVIVITGGGTGYGKYTAKIGGAGTGNAVWFAFLPSSANTPYEIQVLAASLLSIRRKPHPESTLRYLFEIYNQQNAS